jgi:hypothetical protein
MDNLFEPLVIVVSREEVETCNIEPALTILNRLISSPAIAQAYKEKVDITFHGFDKDQRELFEIETVRGYVFKLDNDFPFWLFFLSKHYTGLQALLLCLLPPYLTEEGKAKVFPERIKSILTKRWFPAMNNICDFAGISDSENEQLTEKALQYISSGPLPL